MATVPVHRNNKTPSVGGESRKLPPNHAPGSRRRHNGQIGQGSILPTLWRGGLESDWPHCVPVTCTITILNSRTPENAQETGGACLPLGPVPSCLSRNLSSRGNIIHRKQMCHGPTPPSTPQRTSHQRKRTTFPDNRSVLCGYATTGIPRVVRNLEIWVGGCLAARERLEYLLQK